MQISNDGITPGGDIQDACAEPVQTPQAHQDPNPPSVSEPKVHDSVESYQATGDQDNAWVARAKADKAQTEQRGVGDLERADAHGGQADRVKSTQDQKASSQWSAGHHLAAFTSKAAGIAGYVGHTVAQAAYTAVAAGESVRAGIDDVEMGNKKAVQKVALGAAAIAALPTGGASFSLLTAVGAGSTAYTAIDGMGKMERARNGKDVAVGAVETGLAFAAPALGRGVGAALGATPAFQAGVQMLAKPVAEWVGAGMVGVSESLAAKLGAPAIANAGLEAASRLLPESGQLAAHLAGHLAKDSFEKLVERRVKDATGESADDD